MRGSQNATHSSQVSTVFEHNLLKRIEWTRIMFKVLPSPFSAAGPRVNPFFRRSSILKSTEIYVAQCYRSQSSVNPAIFSRLLLESTTIYLIAFSDYIYNKLIVSVLFDKCLLSRENMEISYFFTGFWMEQHLVLLSRVDHKFFIKKSEDPHNYWFFWIW